LDFAQPVALLLIALLHLLPDADDPAGIVARLLAPLAPGSYLALQHLGLDANEPKALAVSAAAGRDGVTLLPRRRTEILRFFDGLELVEPGLVQDALWRPDGEVPAEFRRSWGFAGVARKP